MALLSWLLDRSIRNILALNDLAKSGAYGSDFTEETISELPVNTVFQSYHLMVAMFGLIALTTLLAFIFTFRKGRIASMRWLQNLAIASPLFPFLAIEAGWFTAEIGRQPWVVYPATSSPEGVSLLTQASSSASVTSPELAITLALFLLIYLFLIIGWARIVIHLIKVGPRIDESGETNNETARKTGNNNNGNVEASIGKAGE